MQNRIIKFRVWNGLGMEYNIMLGVFGVFWVNPMSKGDGLNEKDTVTLTPFNTKYPDITPVMQYTGLKDKNGKEIYEGDIIQIRDNKKQLVEEGEVVWSHVWLRFSVNSWGFSSDNITEVIGNAYQKPNY